jgi:hypothetical protein
VNFMANLSQADYGNEDMRVDHKGIGLLPNSRFTSLVSYTRNILRDWEGVMC